MMLLNGLILASALVFPHNTPYQLNEEAKSLLSAGRNLEAVAAARQAVAEASAEFGARHPATAMILRNLASACERSGYYSLAEYNAKLALSILEETFGPGDVSLVPVLNVLAETYFAQGRHAEAREAAQRAVAIGPEAGEHHKLARHNLAAIRGAR
jgi:tetratricopeptide (TPR) repeat protein